MKKLLAALLIFSAVISSTLAAAVNSESAECIELPIIMYHHFLKSPERWGSYVVSPQQLENDLDYLKSQGYTTIGCKELIAWSEGRAQLPEKPVMLTFDDGQESVEAYALPILEAHDAKAVVAIVGSIADTYTKNEDHNLNYSYLNWRAVAALSDNPHLEFAVHTHDLHKMNSRRGCAKMRGEDEAAYRKMFSADLDIIEGRFLEYTGEVPAVFAYPYGSCCDAAHDVLQSRGYRVVFTCDEHVNRLTGEPSELLELGRFNRASGLSSPQFFAKLTK